MLRRRFQRLESGKTALGLFKTLRGKTVLGIVPG